MGIIMALFYGLVGLAILFLIILYAVRGGIDSSNEVKAIRSELKDIKKILNDLRSK